MKIVLDANIFISALMGSRGKLTILTSQNHEFFAPSRIIDEIKKYKKDVCKKTGWSSEDFDAYFAALMFFVNTIEYPEYEKQLSAAQSTIGKRDSKDAVYLACALAINADFIWTEDKDFSAQNLVQVKTTDEFIEDAK